MIPKFRAWDKENEVMSCIDEVDFNSGIVLISTGFRYFENLEIMQYTRLKDKNGVEIFEDDIVRIKSSDGVDYKALIIFKDGGFCAVDGMNDDYSTRRYQLHKGDFELEVIGNQFQHPHLLEE